MGQKKYSRTLQTLQRHSPEKESWGSHYLVLFMHILFLSSLFSRRNFSAGGAQSGGFLTTALTFSHLMTEVNTLTLPNLPKPTDCPKFPSNRTEHLLLIKDPFMQKLQQNFWDGGTIDSFIFKNPSSLRNNKLLLPFGTKINNTDLHGQDLSKIDFYWIEEVNNTCLSSTKLWLEPNTKITFNRCNLASTQLALGGVQIQFNDCDLRSSIINEASSTFTVDLILTNTYANALYLNAAYLSLYASNSSLRSTKAEPKKALRYSLRSILSDFSATEFTADRVIYYSCSDGDFGQATCTEKTPYLENFSLVANSSFFSKTIIKARSMSDALFSLENCDVLESELSLPTGTITARNSDLSFSLIYADSITKTSRSRFLQAGIAASLVDISGCDFSETLIIPKSIENIVATVFSRSAITTNYGYFKIKDIRNCDFSFSNISSIDSLENIKDSLFTNTLFNNKKYYTKIEVQNNNNMPLLLNPDLTGNNFKNCIISSLVTINTTNSLITTDELIQARVNALQASNTNLAIPQRFLVKYTARPFPDFFHFSSKKEYFASYADGFSDYSQPKKTLGQQPFNLISSGCDPFKASSVPENWMTYFASQLNQYTLGKNIYYANQKVGDDAEIIRFCFGKIGAQKSLSLSANNTVILNADPSLSIEKEKTWQSIAYRALKWATDSFLNNASFGNNDNERRLMSIVNLNKGGTNPDPNHYLPPFTPGLFEACREAFYGSFREQRPFDIKIISENTITIDRTINASNADSDVTLDARSVTDCDRNFNSSYHSTYKAKNIWLMNPDNETVSLIGSHKKNKFITAGHAPTLIFVFDNATRNDIIITSGRQSVTELGTLEKQPFNPNNGYFYFLEDTRVEDIVINSYLMENKIQLSNPKTLSRITINNVANPDATAKKIKIYTKRSPPPHIFTAGEIAGITIGSAAGLAIIIGSIILCIKMRNKDVTQHSVYLPNPAPLTTIQTFPAQPFTNHYKVTQSHTQPKPPILTHKGGLPGFFPSSPSPGSSARAPAALAENKSITVSESTESDNYSTSSSSTSSRIKPQRGRRR